MRRALQALSELTSQTCLTGGQFSFILNTLGNEGELQDEKAVHFRNPIINEESEVHDQRLQPSGAAQYLNNNRLVIYRLVNHAVRLTYGNQRAELHVWVEWLLALCGVDEGGRHSLRLLATKGHFFCQWGLLRHMLATTSLCMTREVC